MYRRAGGPDRLRCENCGLKPKGNLFEYDHTVELWELPSELRERFLEEGVPAEYGKLLCVPCHDEKSGKKAGERAHGNRIFEKAAKAKPKKRSSFKTNRDGPYKVELTSDGPRLVNRATGEPVR
jgi:hypothetical protein